MKVGQLVWCNRNSLYTYRSAFSALSRRRRSLGLLALATCANADRPKKRAARRARWHEPPGCVRSSHKGLQARAAKSSLARPFMARSYVPSYFCYTTLVFLLLIFSFALSASPLKLREGDVVAFAGGTDMVRMQSEGRLEAALTHHSLEASPKFRDLAWDGDTVYFQSTVGERWREEAFGNWNSQLNRVGATVVIAQFGKIESLEGGERLPAFIEAYGKLIDSFSSGGRQVLLLGPSPFEWEGMPVGSLQEYTLAIEQLAAQRGLQFVAPDQEEPVGSFIRALSGSTEISNTLVSAVQEKHRLWYEYWRPANWKCLFGDDSERIFSNEAAGLPSFKEEWSIYPQLIAEAEARVFAGKGHKVWTPRSKSGSPAADIETELQSFEVLDGFEINLFADESMGVTNPLSVRWDAQGRMYVTCSDVYPQIEPGVKPDDRIILLEDTDRDGKADRSSVFASGLNIPTGMEVGHGTVYVGQGTELLALSDADFDGVAENRKVLLSGFGNGDSHQTINTFVWSPNGNLWFGQGDGIESRVETPFGISTLFQAGVFRLNPRTLQLDGLLDDFMGPGNPWGVAFDDYGQSFVIDGAGGGISHLTPGTIPVKRRLNLQLIGKAGGYCGIECLGAGNLPEAIQGDFVIGDYKKNQVSRFSAIEDGAGFTVEWKKPLMRSSHRNFRPVDVKLGPDGAIYVVDWYNPITCHQDDFYRHPDRDMTHGRIWRLVPKAGTLPLPSLVGKSTKELVHLLGADERWTRIKAKQLLNQRPPEEVGTAIREWISTQNNIPGRNLLEAISLLEWIDTPDDQLLGKVLRSEDHRVRAYGTRVAGRWGERLQNVFGLLENAASDDHPLVRMESILASAHIPSSRSILITAITAEAPRDRWIDYAFSQAVYHLQKHWLPVFRRGELDFNDHPSGFAAVLGQADSKRILPEIRSLLKGGELGREEQIILYEALATAGNEQDLQWVLKMKLLNPRVLRALAERGRPNFPIVDSLKGLLLSGDIQAKTETLRLVGNWRVGELKGQVIHLIGEEGPDQNLNRVAIETLGRIGTTDELAMLGKIAANGSTSRQIAAVLAILRIDAGTAADLAARILKTTERPELIANILSGFVARESGGKLLADSLGKTSVSHVQGERLHKQWIATGLVDTALSERIDELAGISVEDLSYSTELIDTLVDAGKHGDQTQGRMLFESSRIGCMACHQVGEQGGQIGPDLTAVGSGTPFDRIVTEVLWPGRQVKAGFALTRVTMKDKRVFQGYIQPSRKKANLLLRDFSTGQIQAIPQQDIASTETLGSLMPSTSQSLSRSELIDLLSYLFLLSG